MIKLFFVLKRVISWIYAINVLCSCVFVSRYQWRYCKIRPQGHETVKVHQLSEIVIIQKVQMFWNVFKNCLKLLLHLWAVFLCCTEWHAVLFYSLKMFFIQSVYDDMVKHLIIKINFDFISIEKGNFIYRFLWFLVLVTIATVFNFHIYYRCCQTKTTV